MADVKKSEGEVTKKVVRYYSDTLQIDINRYVFTCQVVARKFREEDDNHKLRWKLTVKF